VRANSFVPPPFANDLRVIVSPDWGHCGGGGGQTDQDGGGGQGGNDCIIGSRHLLLLLVMDIPTPAQANSGSAKGQGDPVATPVRMLTGNASIHYVSTGNISRRLQR
jgi:hypothetical protein